MKDLPRQPQFSTVRGTNREQPAPYLRYWEVLFASRRAAGPPSVFAEAAQYVADPGWMTTTSATHCSPSRENSRSPRALAGGWGPIARAWSTASLGLLGVGQTPTGKRHNGIKRVYSYGIPNGIPFCHLEYDILL
jgi:hypothetical protein